MAGKGVSFDTGLARSKTLTPGESKRLAAWYSEQHGAGNLDLVGFVSLLMQERPDVLKRHRFVAEAKNHAQKIGTLANVLLFLHYYTVIGNEKGILYETIAARKAGGTKAEIMATICLAYLHGAANGLNAVASLSLGYLRDWKGTEREGDPSPWPEGWSVDPAAFRADLDGEADVLAPIERWYRSFGLEIPAYVQLLARFRPDVLREWRALQEDAASAALPKQMIPLCLLHLAIIRGSERGIRLAAAQARPFGVTRDQLLDAICWAMSYSGELGLTAVGDLLLEIVDGWPAPRP